jgi:hypothetical protein
LDTKTPLGYIELENGRKPIYPMNDFFLNYMFNITAYWETLRKVANITVDAYRRFYAATHMRRVEGEITVATQYSYILDAKNKTRDQDIKMTDSEKLTYIEFHNRARGFPPVETRAVEYFGLGIGHSGGKGAEQIWLLAEDVESLLCGEPFARYVLSDEASGRPYPYESGILFVSLTQLAEGDGPAGELARFLLGRPVEPQDEDVREIKRCFGNCLDVLKEDKEVNMFMSVAERYQNYGREEGIEEGIVIGEARGEARGAARLLELIKSGLSPDEAMQRITDESNSQAQAV